MTRAPLGRRAAAYVIDLVTAVLSLALGAGVGSALAGAIGMAVFVIPAFALIFGVAWLLGYSAMQGRRGSLGMRVREIRLQRADADSPIGFGRALLRNLVWGLGACILVGYFSPLFDSNGRFQGWHDKASRAVMIDARAVADTGPAEAPPTAPVEPAPILQAPRFDRVAPAPVGGFAPAGEEAPRPARPSAIAPVAPEGTMIASVPGITPRAAASEDVAETRVTRDPRAITLIWDDGTRHTVGRRTLFGRNPAPEEGAATVAVRDETLSLSKTHVEVDVGSEGAWIIDRHSTNGVTIVRAGRRIPCVPGQREPLHPGDALEIGDRVVTLGGLS